MPPPNPLRSYPLEEARERLLKHITPFDVNRHQKEAEMFGVPVEKQIARHWEFSKGMLDTDARRAAQEYMKAVRKAEMAKFKEDAKAAKKAKRESLE